MNKAEVYSPPQQSEHKIPRYVIAAGLISTLISGIINIIESRRNKPFKRKLPGKNEVKRPSSSFPRAIRDPK